MTMRDLSSIFHFISKFNQLQMVTGRGFSGRGGEGREGEGKVREGMGGEGKGRGVRGREGKERVRGRGRKHT